MTQNDKRFFMFRCSIYLLIILYSLFGIIEDGFTICFFHNVTSLLCYTCGLTRAFMCFFRLDFVQALEYNPLVIVFVPLFVFIVIEDVITFIYNLKTNKRRPSFIKHYLF